MRINAKSKPTVRISDLRPEDAFLLDGKFFLQTSTGRQFVGGSSWEQEVFCINDRSLSKVVIDKEVIRLPNAQFDPGDY